MNINWIIWTLLSFLIIPETHNTSLQWVDSLITYITQNSEIQQLTFFENPEHPMHHNMDEILIEVMKKVPTVQIDTKELTVENSTVLENTSDISSTLYIHYHDSRATIILLNNIIDSIVECFGVKTRPKLLLVLVTRLLHDSRKELLEYAWTHDLLDFTIIELCGTEEKSEKTIVVESSVTIPVIHQLNPFKKMYIRQNWTHEIEWFPNKLTNMWAYPLNIGIFDSPFSLMKLNEFQQPIEFYGPDGELTKDIGRLLNCSFNLLLFTKFLPHINNISDLDWQKVLESRKVDILSSPLPFITGVNLRSEFIDETRSCAIVPVLSKMTLPLSVSFVLAPLASFAIVISFSILKEMFRFRGRIWLPFNILRVFFGIGVNDRPTGNADRTIFVCLLFVSSIFSTSIYEALTGISLRTNGEREFKSFDDLDNSGLIPMIRAGGYNKTFAYSDGALNNIKKKTLITTNTKENCLHIALEYKNVTCIMTHAEFQDSIKSIGSEKRKQLKTAKPCFWKDLDTLYLAKGSPYRFRINDAIRMLRGAGFLSKWYNVETGLSKSSGGKHLQSLPGSKENMRSIRNQLLAIAIVGYSMAFLALIVEIITFKIVKYKWLQRLKIIRIVANMIYRWRR